MWLWDTWLGRSVPKRVSEASKSAPFEVRTDFGLQNRAQAVVEHASKILSR